MQRLRTTITAIMLSIFALTLVSAPTSAQSDLNTRFYSYISNSADTLFMVGVTTSSIPGMAAELVSPKYASDFFEGFGSLTNYDFASDLTANQVAIVAQADEYMVFDGTLDFYDGPRPGYVIFLSSNDVLFIVVGYQSDAAEMFALTDEVLNTGDAPVRFPGFTRTLVNEEGSGTTGSSGTSNGSGSRNQGNGGFDTVVCNVDPNVAPIDVNNDGYLDQDEMFAAALVIEEAWVVYEYMVENGIDAIQYRGC